MSLFPKNKQLWSPVVTCSIPEKQTVISQLYDDFGICIARCMDRRLEGPLYAVLCPTDDLAPLFRQEGIDFRQGLLDFHTREQGALSVSCFPRPGLAYPWLARLYDIIYH